MYHWTFLIRRVILAVALIWYKDDAIYQLNLYTYSSVFILLWHALVRPFKDKFSNLICILNEMLIIGLCVICRLFTDKTYHEDSTT